MDWTGPPPAACRRLRNLLTHEDLQTSDEEKQARRESKCALAAAVAARLEEASENNRLRARIVKLEPARAPSSAETGP